MHLLNELLFRSLKEAIENGRAWSPAFHESFLIKIATRSSNLPATFAALHRQAPDQYEIVSEFLSENGVSEDETNIVKAKVLARCLESCEDDSERTNEAAAGTPPPIEITRRGVTLKDATILGELELDGLVFERPLNFIHCKFDSDVNLSYAKLGKVSFEESVFSKRLDDQSTANPLASNAAESLRGVRLNGSRINGLLNFRDIRAGFIQCGQSTIMGNAVFAGATIGPVKSDKDSAISFNGATLDTLMIRHGAKIYGSVDIIACKATEIDFAGVCIDAKRNKYAILARSVRIRSQLELSGYIDDENIYHPTEIYGPCYFPDAKIGGDLRLRGARIFARNGDRIAKIADLSHFDNLRQKSLIFPNAEIDGSVFLERIDIVRADLAHKPNGDSLGRDDGQIQIMGEVDFRGAVIGGDFRLEGAKLCGYAKEKSRKARLIDLRNANIKRMIVLKSLHESCDGSIDLRETRCRVYRDDFDVTPWPKELIFLLVGFEYEAFALRDGSVQGRKNEKDSPGNMDLSKKARRKWLLQQPQRWNASEFQPQPWIQCAKVLAEMGFDNVAHHIMLNREALAVNRFNKNAGGFEKFVRGILVKTCGHGHQMWRLTIPATIFAIIAVFSAHVAANANLMRPTNSRILTDDRYLQSGELPLAYSPLRPTYYGLGRMLPSPPIPGRGEWEPCNGQLIADAYAAFKGGAKFATCLPADCQFPKRYGATCTILPLADAKDSDEDSATTDKPVIFDVVSATPWLNHFLNRLENLGGIASKSATSARYGLNWLFSNGVAFGLLLTTSVVGWFISILLTIFAVGYLKRKE